MEALQALPRHELRQELLRCCHSNAWADAVLGRMPFKSEEEAREAMDDCWAKLTPADYLEAVAAHPAIGDKQALRDKFAPSRSGWEDKEQASAAGASETVLDELSELNEKYRRKNGFVFLVCASGLPADAILALLKARLPNDRDTEIRNAVEEQRKITQLRFARLLTEISPPAIAGGASDTNKRSTPSGSSRL
ncbi:putative OHCU decarboxylase [Ectocarpus siliculosus]|uniref:2-oxo-4-hydroxy-4-carboxy-5-ureidoimidazoline decarboxylase n=1 Tax=Ectocarpus siliculosus TaxID=2880 RepID=D7FIQ6_ECTSI|nr:putative OHCU decarboxylase [Ectocarpus siliculosus]|eukprot:CBJ28874.1 putative OHCU decarboxylase [Ectocarpus siliculosus]